ncbi:hypothetical protein FQN57_004369 [Myotisia sp. PD_48]|nr:hypothetical protein FQN57_004369 [Myotisia sp. PD_48]
MARNVLSQAMCCSTVSTPYSYIMLWRLGSLPEKVMWKISEALPIYRLHDHVQALAMNIAYKALDNCKFQPAEKWVSTSPSRSEIDRIQRALYQFEIYCNLFRTLEHDIYPGPNQMEVFFSKFSPWENEQLAPVLDDLGTNEPRWASFYAVVGTPETFGLQKQLSLGLHHLRALMLANSDKERKLLVGEPENLSHLDFLDEALPAANGLTRTEVLADMDSEDEEEFIFPARFPDGDSGAEDIWRWAHQSDMALEFVLGGRHKQLRKWAYVMWDRTRLDSWGIFCRPWDGPDAIDEDDSKTHQSKYVSRALAMVKEGRLSPSFYYRY